MRDFTSHDKIKVEMAINDLNDQKDKLALKKREIDLKLGQYNSRVKSIGARNMDRVEYSSICREQYNLKKERDAIETEILSINALLRRNNTLKEEIGISLKGNIDTKADMITDLITKYREFSKDHTRVASTRIMATKFVEELEQLLK